MSTITTPYGKPLPVFGFVRTEHLNVAVAYDETTHNIGMEFEGSVDYKMKFLDAFYSIPEGLEAEDLFRTVVKILSGGEYGKYYGVTKQEF